MADYTGSISLSQARGDLSHTSDDEEDDHHSPRTATPLTGPISTTRSGGETSNRKPRGRPPGSKNKPKPPIVVTRDIESAMKPVILEIAPNSDIIDMVNQFARRQRAGISILSASGSVTNITLRHAGSHAPTLTFHGTFEILSLSGSFMGSSPSSSSSSSFGISLSGAQGQVFGGIVAGKAVAATPVVVVAAVFVSPTYHRLPREFEEGDERKPIIGGGSGGGGGGGGGSEGCSSSGVSMNVYGVAAPTPLNSQISPPTDHHRVLPWGPTSRQPPPY